MVGPMKSPYISIPYKAYLTLVPSLLSFLVLLQVLVLLEAHVLLERLLFLEALCIV